MLVQKGKEKKLLDTNFIKDDLDRLLAERGLHFGSDSNVIAPKCLGFFPLCFVSFVVYQIQ